jgi:hypothetical protein
MKESKNIEVESGPKLRHRHPNRHQAKAKRGPHRYIVPLATKLVT